MLYVIRSGCCPFRSFRSDVRPQPRRGAPSPGGNYTYQSYLLGGGTAYRKKSTAVHTVCRIVVKNAPSSPSVCDFCRAADAYIWYTIRVIIPYIYFLYSLIEGARTTPASSPGEQPTCFSKSAIMPWSLAIHIKWMFFFVANLRRQTDRERPQRGTRPNCLQR